MVNLKHIRTAAAGAMLAGMALATAPALADSARADISGFTVQLTDLDTADGIAPSLSFFSQAQHRSYSLTADGVYDSQDAWGYGSLGRDDADGMLLSSVGSTALSSGVDGRMAGGQFLASSDWSGQFHLSPSTAVVFSAQARVDTAPGSGLEVLSRATMAGSLGANSGFNISLVNEGGTPSKSGLLYGELRSGSGSAGADGYLGMFSTAWVVTSPVPEPGSGAMLLAGLALVGGLALRGRARRRGPARPSGLPLRTHLRRPRLLASGAAAALALAAGGAAAQSSAAVSLGAWHYTLTDLAPLDGIAPSITLAPQAGSPAYQSIAWHGRPQVEGQDWEGETNDSGAPLYWADGGNTASAWSLPGSIEVAVHSEGTPVLASGLRQFSFTLSPFTQVAFFEDGHLSSSGLLGAPGARARLSVDLPFPPGGATGWDEAELSTSGARDFSLFAAAASQGEAAAGTVTVRATSFVLVPIPEPEQYAMWLAGLSLLFALRRSSR